MWIEINYAIILDSKGGFHVEKQLKRDAFFHYHFLSDVTYAPNGKRYAYIDTQADTEHNAYTRNLHIGVQGKTTPLTADGKVEAFIWDDKDTILFSAMRDEAIRKKVEAGEEWTSFYRISIKGGEAQPAFAVPLNVQKIEKVKKGVYLLMVLYDLNYSDMYACKEKAKGQLLKQKQDSRDYEVIDELPYTFNGMGYINKKRMSLFLYQESSGKLTRISDRNMAVSHTAWNDDHTLLYYSGYAYQTVKEDKEGIYAYDLTAKETSEIVAPHQYELYDLQVWNNQLFFAGTETKRYGLNENPWFYTVDENKCVQLLAENENTLGSSVGSDCRLGAGRYALIIHDRYFYITTQNGDSCLYAMDKQGRQQKIAAYTGSIDCFDINQEDIIWVGMKEQQLQEIYHQQLNSSNMEQLTHIHAKMMQDVYTAKPQPIQFHRDGYDLQGWVLLPKGYDTKKQYPAILDIHGGPKTVYGEVFYHEMQVWANEGYFVCFMNPRGSDGRGNAFADIYGKYGTGDYEDLMMFTDEVLRAYPQIDEKRFGVTGGSYGGFMTNWIIGHTKRFAAAASQRSIANWIAFEHTSDIGPDFTKDQQRASTWENLEKLWFHSPLQYADQVVTPTLFIHSDEDYRCPLSEGQQMVSALMEHGVETRMVMFKGENHELSRSGKPLHRLRRLNEITDWMNHYLK